MSFLVQFFIVRGPSCRSLLQYGIDSFQNMSSVTQHTVSDCNLGWLQSFIFLGLRRQWWTALVVQSNQTLDISFLMLLLVLAGLHVVSKCDFGLVAECDFGLKELSQDCVDELQTALNFISCSLGDLSEHARTTDTSSSAEPPHWAGKWSSRA